MAYLRIFYVQVFESAPRPISLSSRGPSFGSRDLLFKYELARSRFSAELPRHLKYGLLGRHGRIFQRRREGNRHVHRPYALHRPVEIIESAFGDHRGDLRGYTVAVVAFVDDHGPRSLLRRFDQRALVERPRGARVDDLGADS